MGQLLVGNQLNPLHVFPSCRQTHTFKRNLKDALAEDLGKHNTITEVWIFWLDAWQGACVVTSQATPSFSKNCKLDWWQQLAKFSPAKKKRHLCKQRGQHEAGIWFSVVIKHSLAPLNIPALVGNSQLNLLVALASTKPYHGWAEKVVFHLTPRIILYF